MHSVHTCKRNTDRSYYLFWTWLRETLVKFFKFPAAAVSQANRNDRNPAFVLLSLLSKNTVPKHTGNYPLVISQGILIFYQYLSLIWGNSLSQVSFNRLNDSWNNILTSVQKYANIKSKIISIMRPICFAISSPEWEKTCKVFGLYSFELVYFPHDWLPVTLFGEYTCRV